MANVVTEMQSVITLAGTDPDAAADRFDLLVARHGRIALAGALKAIAPEVIAESLAGRPMSPPN